MMLSDDKTEPVATKSISPRTINIAKEKKVIYTIKSGDTLYGIARKFNIAVADIKRWNSALNTQLIPGKKITIFHAS
jgi:LysM repeat protein